MTKATLIDSCYASYHNETVNYVADCADRPFCSLPQTKQQAHVRAGHQGEGGGGWGVLTKNNIVSFK